MFNKRGKTIRKETRPQQASFLGIYSFCLALPLLDPTNQKYPIPGLKIGRISIINPLTAAQVTEANQI
jgi:hypothetical protein